MARWTRQQVVGLAPDPRSVAAARGLARPGRWSDLGCTESLVWGRCQGSGKEPYQVTVDLTEPSFRCTCPSRKFPCKHGLALLLLWVEGDGSVAHVDAVSGPADDRAGDRAAEWAAGRAPARPARTTAAAPDPEARAARVAARLALMDAGLDDHERWMRDLVRQGLGSARTLPYSAWDGAAARLVDAQVPRLADRVRAVGGAVHRRPDWPDLLLAELGRGQLAARAWRRRDDPASAPAEALADVRAVLGWPVPSAEVRSGATTTDTWHVVGLRRDGDDRVQSQRTWLHGTTTGVDVVLLDFAGGAGVLEVAHVLGALVEGEVAEYPGSPPRRAILLDGHRTVGASGDVAGATDVAGALATVAASLAADPFRERVLVRLGGVVVAPGPGDTPVLVDAGDRALPVHPAVDVDTLLAVTGAAPVDVVAEWDDGWVVPLSLGGGAAALVPVPVDDEAPDPPSAVAGPGAATAVDGDDRWSALVSVALVGTDRRQPPDGGVSLDLAGEVDAAGRLLLEAAVEDVRRRAGSVPLTVVERFPAAPPDDRPEAPAAAVQLLELVLGGAAGLTTGRDAVLAEWFGACEAAGARVPHRLVVPVGRLARHGEAWRGGVLAAVGTRGRWLAEVRPQGGDTGETWDGPSGEDDDAVWATGTPAERRRVLQRRRASDPAAGRDLLASTWASERAADRAAFVELLAVGLSEADTDLLEAALRDRSTTVRSRAATLLDHLPASPRGTRLAARLEPLVRLDARGRLAVELPDAPRGSDVADLPGATPPKGLGARAWQLAELVAGVALDRWAEWVDPEPRRTIEAAGARAELVAGWARAAVAQRRADWAAALLVHRIDPALVEVLDPADRAAAASWLLAAAPPVVVPAVLAAVPAPWTPELVDRILAWADATALPPAAGLAAAELLAARAAPAEAEVVGAWLADRPQQDTVRRALRAAHHALGLRAAVHDAFTTDPPELP